MRVVYNRVIPFRGFKCVNLFGVLFVREGCTMAAEDYNHEAIHTAQMKELLYVPFYVLYVLEWVWYLVRLRNANAAYLAISFEREAYDHENDMEYLKTRKMFNQYKTI
jgi:hypothetical protein